MRPGKRTATEHKAPKWEIGTGVACAGHTHGSRPPLTHPQLLLDNPHNGQSGNQS